MGNYEDLVRKRQDGEIDDLEFLLAQEDLAELYLADLRDRGINPTPENAADWLLRYENDNLYEQDYGLFGE